MTTIGLLTRIRHHLISYQFNRCLSTQTASGIVFNKNLRVKHLDRSSIDKEAHVYDYLRDHVAKDVCDRIEDLKHDGRRLIFNLGSCSGLIVKNLNPGKIDTLIQADISLESIRRSRRSNSMLPPKFPIDYVQCDEESLPTNLILLILLSAA
ncbi:hypothetical protein SUGI_1511220 [Cryptomeria japonica]|uniref:Uncharacterized protein n=1 Tax=Cryptomeria japonica TaxID=3369 RepID=A0AAD3RRX5_CRYJA|nr:hypothetical protein SUGI_1511220 [Cryptomeria japonica]